MDVVLFGPPGAGKGTQAGIICEALKTTHISTGDLFRALDKGSDLGKKVNVFMSKGQLVPDDVTMQILGQRLEQGDTASVLYDGFPRTSNQADEMFKWFGPRNRKIDLVLAITITDEEVMRRLTNRRMCRNCGASWHLIFVPTEQEGICDKCGGELYQRKDDKREKIQQRVEGYHTWTAPMLTYLAEKGVPVIKVDGMNKPSAVSDTIKQKLQQFLQN